MRKVCASTTTTLSEETSWMPSKARIFCGRGYRSWRGIRTSPKLTPNASHQTDNQRIVRRVFPPGRVPPFAHIEVRIGARSIVTEALDIDGSRVNCIHLPCNPMEPVLEVSDVLSIVVVAPRLGEAGTEEKGEEIQHRHCPQRSGSWPFLVLQSPEPGLLVTSNHTLVEVNQAIKA